MKKITSKIALILVFSFVLVSIREIRIVKADSTIYIRADGSVEGTDKIQRDGNIYTFTANIYDPIVVERDNIVVDGAGYTLQGAGVTLPEQSNYTGIGNTTGIDVSLKHDVTIKNMRITGFDTGIHIKNASRNIITGNDITNNLEGIIIHSSRDNVISANNLTTTYFAGILLLSLSKGNTLSENYIANNGVGIDLLYYSSNNTISTNNIINNSWGVIFSHFSTNNSMVRNLIENNTDGIYFKESSDNIFLHNTFLNNSKHVFDRAMLGFLCPPDPSINIWDNGIEGNYWDNYNGTDSDNDGIGDTPYLIYENNQDNHPLMHPWDTQTPQDTTPPTISIISPENKTYTVSNVSLAFNVSESTSWIGYSLDGQANVTITGNTTLTGLSNALHNLTVYANDTDGNTGASETIYFTIAQQSESFPITWIAAAIVIIAVVGAVLLVYFARVKKTTGKAE